MSLKYVVNTLISMRYAVNSVTLLQANTIFAIICNKNNIFCLIIKSLKKEFSSCMCSQKHVLKIYTKICYINAYINKILLSLDVKELTIIAKIVLFMDRT